MKHRVTLTFLLDEEVTPDLFAERMALACAQGVLKPGEGIELPSDPSKLLLLSPSRFPEVTDVLSCDCCGEAGVVAFAVGERLVCAACRPALDCP